MKKTGIKKYKVKDIMIMEKSVLRKEMKRLRREMTADERKIRNEKLFENLTELNSFKNKKWFYIYVSYGTEADTKEIIKYLLKLKKEKDIHIAVPKVLGTEMEFFEIDSLDELKKSNMGILEPDNHRLVSVKDVKYCERLNPAENVVMILPGLAFDIEHGRVGYGGGFYDKYLNRYSADEFCKIGICYDFQMQKYDTIEMEENDMKVDMVVTDKAYY